MTSFCCWSLRLFVSYFRVSDPKKVINGGTLITRWWNIEYCCHIWQIESWWDLFTRAPFKKPKSQSVCVCTRVAGFSHCAHLWQEQLLKCKWKTARGAKIYLASSTHLNELRTLLRGRRDPLSPALFRSKQKIEAHIFSLPPCSLCLILWLDAPRRLFFFFFFSPATVFTEPEAVYREMEICVAWIYTHLWAPAGGTPRPLTGIPPRTLPPCSWPPLR